MPPLSEREHDGLKLAEHFLHHYSDVEDKSFAGFSTDAEQLISDYSWPGNVRQLQNVIHSAVVMSQGPMISKKIIASQLEARGASMSHQASNHRAVVSDGKSAEMPLSHDDGQLSLAEIERRAITQTIKRCSGNVVKAASELEVSPSTLYRKIQQWQESSDELNEHN